VRLGLGASIIFYVCWWLRGVLCALPGHQRGALGADGWESGVGCLQTVHSLQQLSFSDPDRDQGGMGTKGTKGNC
jgi:hypothetical protein